MKTPEFKVSAIYTDIVQGEVADAESLIKRLLAGEVPAFVIKNAGVSLARATENTGIVATLRANGYKGNIRDSVGFGSETRVILPADLSHIVIPQGVEWHWAGVTTLHSDMLDSERGACISLNFTSEGRSEFRMHTSRISEEEFDDQFEILDSQTGQLLWRGLVDPELISPEGFIAEVKTFDLLVFDPSYAHMSRALTRPRRAEATFFAKK